MNKRVLLRLLPILPILPIISLPSCALAPPVSPPAAVPAPAPWSDPDARRAEILRQIRAICPQPLTPAELAAAADHLDTHPDALPLVQRLDLADRQARICRGEPT